MLKSCESVHTKRIRFGVLVAVGEDKPDVVLPRRYVYVVPVSILSNMAAPNGQGFRLLLA